MKIYISVVLLFLSIQLSFSQEFEVPTNVKLEKAEDYKNYEADILKCINWLENTPIEQDEEKRLKANAFLMLWITGAPNVTVGMQSFQLDLTKKNPALLMNFIGGWIKHCLENPDEKDDDIAANVSGLKSLMKVYAANKGKGIKKNKKVEKILKLNDEELKQYVIKKME